MTHEQKRRRATVYPWVAHENIAVCAATPLPARELCDICRETSNGAMGIPTSIANEGGVFVVRMFYDSGVFCGFGCANDALRGMGRLPKQLVFVEAERNLCALFAVMHGEQNLDDIYAGVRGVRRAEGQGTAEIVAC